MRALTSMFNFRDLALEDAILRRGPTPSQPGMLEHGMSGQGHRRSSVASARRRACVHSARALLPLIAERPERETAALASLSEQEREAPSRYRSLLGRDRHLPVPVHVRDSSERASAAGSTNSRRDRPRDQCHPRQRCCYADPRCAQACPQGSAPAAPSEATADLDAFSFAACSSRAPSGLP
jgi:hypothetical protein